MLVYWLLTSYILLSASHVAADVIQLGSNNISQYLQNHITFVKFYAHWCPHSKKFEPIWHEFSEVRQNKEIHIARVDCSKDALLCSDHDIFGYPTVKLFIRGSGARYEGPRDINALEAFYRQKLADESRAEDSIATKTPIIELTTENFLPVIKDGFVFVVFFAPWCKHCQLLKPIFEELSRQLIDVPGLRFASVDCTKYASLCTNNAIQGYPTMVWFEHGEEKDRYVDRRDVVTMRRYIEEKMREAKPIVQEPPPSQPQAEVQAEEVEMVDNLLTAQTFTKRVSYEGYAFVNFGAPWCSHCQRLLSVWNQLAKRFAPYEEIRILRVDCTASEQLCRDYGIRAFPTLILFRYGESKVEYNGSRDVESLYNFVISQLEFFGDEYLLNLDDKETPHD